MAADRKNEGADFNDRETGARIFPAEPEEHDRDRDGATAEVQTPKRKLGLRRATGETDRVTAQADTTGTHIPTASKR